MADQFPPPTPSPDQPRMDHLALASRHAWDQLVRYGYQLGGRWRGGPPMAELDGFYFCQVELEGGTKLELLEPLDSPGSDFIRRFLDRNGPGPHHFTFKVPDFDRALEAVREAGYDLIGVNRSDPDWHEAFLHPKQSHGIVIQLAFEAESDHQWPAIADLPPSRRSSMPVLVAVRHLVADLDAAVELFSGPLAMSEHTRGSNANGELAVVQSGPWNLELIQPRSPEWRHWLGSRPGRLLHLELGVDEPGAVPDAVPLGEGCYEIPPEHNLGTRLVLRSRPARSSESR